MRERWRNDRQHQNSRRAGAQSKNLDVDVPLGKIVGDRGRVRVGQIVAGAGRAVCRGLTAVSGGAVHLHAAQDDAGGAGRGRRGALRPAALALHQRPGVPGIRSTFGTGTELLNSLRLMFSRLANHRCPNGHYLPPTWPSPPGKELQLPGVRRDSYSAGGEELAFNSQGACRTCDGTGIVRTVDLARSCRTNPFHRRGRRRAVEHAHVVADDRCLPRDGRAHRRAVSRADDGEKQIVYDGPAVKKHILYNAKNSDNAGELDFTYYSAVHTVENALSKVKDEKGMKRVEKFLKQDVCPDCGGTRLSEAARAPQLRGITLDEACRMTLCRAGRLGRRRAGQPAGRDAPDGEEHLRFVPVGRAAAAGSGARLSGAGPRGDRPSRPASGSGCSWRAPCATARPACCMCWTSRRSACIRRTSTG